VLTNWQLHGKKTSGTFHLEIPGRNITNLSGIPIPECCKKVYSKKLAPEKKFHRLSIALR
jgi:hypothetical protein